MTNQVAIVNQVHYNQQHMQKIREHIIWYNTKLKSFDFSVKEGNTAHYPQLHTLMEHNNVLVHALEIMFSWCSDGIGTNEYPFMSTINQILMF